VLIEKCWGIWLRTDGTVRQNELFLSLKEKVMLVKLNELNLNLGLRVLYQPPSSEERNKRFVYELNVILVNNVTV
jgi:hypothetical protein